MTVVAAASDDEPGSHGSARIRQRLRGLVKMEPALTMQCLPVTTSTALVAPTFCEIRSNLIVPVERENGDAKIRQTVVQGCGRVVHIDHDVALDAALLPIVVSARRNWIMKDQIIDVFDCAFVIDGASRLASIRDPKASIPILVLFDLDEANELRLLQARRNQDVAPEPTRIDTATPRLTVSTRPVSAKIVSDPFIVPTALGYAPAMLVKRDGALQHEHILIGAKSLAVPIEDFRLRNGSLIGSTIVVSKQGEAKTSAYSVSIEV